MKKSFVGFVLIIGTVLVGIFAIGHHDTNTAVVRLDRATLSSIYGGQFTACNYYTNCSESCQNGYWQEFPNAQSRRIRSYVYKICGYTPIPWLYCLNEVDIPCIRDYYSHEFCDIYLTSETVWKLGCDAIG